MASQKELSYDAESLTLFEIPLRSEISNLLNFLVLDIIFLPFIMYTSGKLAGYVNTEMLRKRGAITLKEFDIPLIGGGMVMAQGWRRTLFILLRLSVVVAVAVSNFGLEGRNSTVTITRSGIVRVPGVLADANRTITEVVLPLVRCNRRIDENTLRKGSVVDGRCYADIPDFAVVRSRTVHETLNASALNCVPSYNCDNTPYPTTTYRCDKSDVVCSGVPETAGCSNQEGMKRNTFGLLECQSVSYGPQDDYAFFCTGQPGVAMPGTSGPLANCYAYEVKRADVERWNETFPSITAMVGKAMFASAYGAERQVQVTVPSDDRPPVTGVRMRWVLSIAWIIAVASLFSLWVLFYMYHDVKEIIHDEGGLVSELQKRMDLDVQMTNDLI